MSPTGTVTVSGLPGLPQVRRGDDLVALILTAAANQPDLGGTLSDGDIIVVTSKIVSKAEGNLIEADDREAAIDAETVRTVARWRGPHGTTRIVQTRHGFVLAAAGVDASNVEPGTVALLPVDPDASARALRAGLRQRGGVRVGVVVSDTFGRPWRDGVVDVAIGAAGVRVRDDLRGQSDAYGSALDVTVVAVADEIASATELVRTKLAGVPVAVVRGLNGFITEDDGPGAAALVRPSEMDRFSLGTAEAMQQAAGARRTVRSFTDHPVDPETVDDAIRAALQAPTPTSHDETPWRFVVVETDRQRKRLQKVLGEALGDAPLVVVPCLAHASGHPLIGSDWIAPSEWMAMGASVENLLVTLSAHGLGSAWVAPSAFDPDRVRAVLDLPEDWLPAGVVLVGHAAERVVEPAPPDVQTVQRYLLRR